MKLSPSVLGIALFASFTLSAQLPNFTPPTPLLEAAVKNNTKQAKKLLEEGANPNDQRLAGFPPIFFAAFNQNLELVRALIAKGADVHAVDAAGSTALMWASANELPDTAVVEEFLKAGVDPNATNKLGENALQWALRRGQTPVVAALMRAGATDNRTKPAVEKALALLQKSGEQFTKVSGCTSCHHQTLPQMASGFARQRGYAVNEKIAKQQTLAVVALFRPAVELMRQGTDAIPDPTISVSYSLLGLHAENYPGDEVTEAMAHLISTKQRPDGSFWAMAARPPMESSEITATALSLRAMQIYGKQPEAAIEKARKWLLTASARTNEERAMQLLGLTWAKASGDDLEHFGRTLLEQQRPDGGWGQLDTLESDSYATGQAMFALHEAGQMMPSDAAYRKGTGFLLRTQLPDGSWLVRSRSFPMQPYKESGFPHGRDQWISASGSAWAAIALSMAPIPSAPKPSVESGGQ